MELKASKSLEIRFSEVDSMKVVWHGSYALYFEDAREAFGEKYDLRYMRFRPFTLEDRYNEMMIKGGKVSA